MKRLLFVPVARAALVASRSQGEVMPTAALRIDEPSTCGVAVMAKASIPGRTRPAWSRLSRSKKQLSCNTAFLRDIADNILVASAQASIAGYMAFGPPHAKPSFFKKACRTNIGLFEAWHPNFGDCLVAAITQLLDRGHRGAVVLNSDSPTLPRRCWSRPPTCWHRPATAPCSDPHMTAAIICSA